MRSIVYHQFRKELHIINFVRSCISSLRKVLIHAKAWWYTVLTDWWYTTRHCRVVDMPLLSQWIKKERSNRFVLFWRPKQVIPLIGEMSRSDKKVMASIESRNLNLWHPLLRCPKVAILLVRGQLLTAAPFRAPFFFHRKRSRSKQLTARDASVNQTVPQILILIMKTKRKTIHKGWFSFWRPKQDLNLWHRG